MGTSLDEYTPPSGMDSKPGTVRVLVQPQEELAGPQSKEHGEGKAGAEPPAAQAQSPGAQPLPQAQQSQPHLAYPYPHPSGGPYGAPGMSGAMSLPMQMAPQRMPGLPVSSGELKIQRFENNIYRQPDLLNRNPSTLTNRCPHFPNPRRGH